MIEQMKTFLTNIYVKMRGFTSTSPSSLENRQRASVQLGDANKRKTQKSNRNYRELANFIQEKSSSCNIRSLKVILVLIICATFIILIQSPVASQNENPLQHGYRSWLWDWTSKDPRYVSHTVVEWTKISRTLDNLDSRNKGMNVGLLNFNATEISHWKQLSAGGEITVIHLEHVKSNITWDVLYPEWIDEEEGSEVPTCPSLPKPIIPKRTRLDVIAVKLPCNRSGEWSRDVARLHLQITAAKLAVEAKIPIHVLFVTECFPILNLFRAEELVIQESNVWLYKPELQILKEKVRLPIGSCELSVPLKATARLCSENAQKEAYATILHSADIYVCGAITAAQSIRMTGSTRDLIILVDETITAHHREGLEAAGWKVRTIKRIRNPKAKPDAYNEWNYSKFRLWQLTDYDKIIFIDADLLVLRNIDFLFTMPEITATANNGMLFNSGVMVIEPSTSTFKLLMDHINDIESYNGGDQGYLNEIFTWWHRIPNHMNFLKHFWEGDEEEIKQMKIHLFKSDPPILYVLHYLGLKPWLCFRDYDCNWNVNIMQEFASDVAHARWWKVHDAMPDNLQKFCLLRTKQKAALEWDRRQAEKANFTDGHWRLKIKDNRLKICVEKLCDWEDMLLHWGETNWTDSNNPPPAIPSINRSHP